MPNRDRRYLSDRRRAVQAWLSVSSVSTALAAAVLMPASIMLAQDNPPVAPDAAARVLLVPDPGLSTLARAALAPLVQSVPPMDDATRRYMRDTTGVTVQNLGQRETIAMAVYLDPAGPASCEGCAFVTAACSEPLSPGGTHSFPAWLEDDSGRVEGLVGAIYALNQMPAASYGSGWAMLIDDLGLHDSASVADVACAAMAGSPPEPGAACPSSAVLAAARGTGPLPFAPTLSAEPLLGEPIGAVVRPLAPVGDEASPAATIDRYRAPDLGAIGALVAPETVSPTFTYDLPGAYGRNPEGVYSVATLHNPGPGCATAVVTPFRTGGVPRAPYTSTVAPGAWLSIDVRREEWQLDGTAALVVESDLPLATALATRAHGFAIARPGSSRADALEVHTLPFAWQALRPFDVDVTDVAAAVDASASAVAPLDARGWESNLSIFNPTRLRRELRMRFQSSGEPPRDTGYPLEERSQVVLQPGFGHGRPGGVGWVEISVLDRGQGPLAAAEDALRSATDVPYTIAAWGVPAWQYAPHLPAPLTIGLPDLGGPAHADPDSEERPGSPALVATSGITNALYARIAIQNPTTSTARVAVDAYARCGFAGSTELRIDPRQATLVSVRDHPGALFGADAAIVRVLAGAATVQVEIARPERFTAADAPLDLAASYLGAPVAALLPPPAALATLTVSPTQLAFDIGTGPVTTTLTIASPESGCMQWLAVPAAPWLSVEPDGGLMPGSTTVAIEHDHLPAAAASGTISTTIRIEARGPLDDDELVLVVPVTLTGLPTDDEQAFIYLPRLERDSTMPVDARTVWAASAAATPVGHSSGLPD